LLPANIKSRGYITIVSDTSFGPPWDFNPTNNPSEFDGIDPSLARGFAKVLGLQSHWVISPFDGIIPALKTGRYDLSMNGMTDTADREKQVDMIHYVNDSDTIVVASGNPDHIAGLSDLCGKTVAVATGTHEADIVQNYQSKCSKKITISLFPSNGPTFLAVKSGRAAATINGYAATFYLQDHHVPGFKGLEGLAQVRLGANPQGIAVPKSDPGLRDAIAAAMNQMIQDGTYHKILATWGIAANALPKVVVNPESSTK
jgi:polar amino acid transport system substrate-binding protein